MANLIKIENYETPAETFTLPYNPQSYDEGTSTFNEVTPIIYSSLHIMIGSRGIQPKPITFTGHFSGTTKDDDYEEVAHKINDGSKLLKVYFRDSRFHIVGGSQFKKTHSNNRTNFLDYVFGAVAFIPIAFSNTQKTASYNGTSWTNGTQTNAGGTFTFIEEIQFTLSAGVTSSDTIEFNSSSRGGITYSFSGSYTSGTTFTIKLVRYEESGKINVTDFFDCYDPSNNKQSKTKSSGKRDLSLDLDKGARIDTYTIGGSASISNATFKWRDGFSGG